jgi:hypothetical protein
VKLQSTGGLHESSLLLGDEFKLISIRCGDDENYFLSHTSPLRLVSLQPLICTSSRTSFFFFLSDPSSIIFRINHPHYSNTDTDITFTFTNTNTNTDNGKDNDTDTDTDKNMNTNTNTNINTNTNTNTNTNG